jgi:hypothetical protein
MILSKTLEGVYAMRKVMLFVVGLMFLFGSVGFAAEAVKAATPAPVVKAEPAKAPEAKKAVKAKAPKKEAKKAPEAKKAEVPVAPAVPAAPVKK